MERSPFVYTALSHFIIFQEKSLLSKKENCIQKHFFIFKNFDTVFSNSSFIIFEMKIKMINK